MFSRKTPSPSGAEKPSPAPSPGVDGARLDALLDKLEQPLEDLTHLLERAAELERRLDAHDAKLEAIGDALATLSDLPERMDTLTVAVAEGITHVDRAERRVRATVGRARSQLRAHGLEHPGVEAEHAELLELDDGGSEGRGVHAVRAPLGEDPEETLSVPDWIPGEWTRSDVARLVNGNS